MKKISPGKKFGSFMAAVCAWFAATPAFAELGQPTPWGIGFQEHASPMKERMEHFHNTLLLPIIIATSLFVLALLIYVVLRFNARANPVPSKTTHNVMLEVLWTLVPVLILVVIVIPSMKMLYFVDRAHNPEMTLKVTGYQWYWGYEYPDHKLAANANEHINFLANMVAEADLKPGQPRLLAADNEIVLPVETDIQILVTASDVIHAFAVPALGVKIDAVPGRTNETWVRIEKEGTFYGQCSELCGVNHAFMPIQLRAVSKEAFAEWVQAQGAVMPAPKAAGDAPAVGATETPLTEVQPADADVAPGEQPATTPVDESKIDGSAKPEAPADAKDEAGAEAEKE